MAHPALKHPTQRPSYQILAPLTVPINQHLFLNPFTPGNYRLKNPFEAKQAIFWSLSGHKRLYKSSNMLSLVPDSKLLILKNRHAQKVTLLSPLLPFAFLAQFFFSFPGHLLGFILVGKAMVKNFSIRELV